ncbi:Na+/H+ antiporter NhaA [Sphingoaurantiacus capsulatus]|uniref:Na(+)/H(+) antiporter NhaA n=1 Tax=Sphingoaurantiacus capsulatus TaxID=1771310 RepID=A0ABV7X9P4_9SPHN
MTERSSTLRAFLATEAAGGFVLIAAAALALIIANSPLAAAYFDMLGTRLGGLSLLHWVNDALMAIFFLLVGLEIKREMLAGELSSWRQRSLPGLAAAAGMAVPALIYLAVAGGDPQAARGWAIPAATDIAFALGVLALLGPRVPASLKIFLTALAILDDMGAVAIIAVFYTEQLALLPLAAALAGLAILYALNRLGVTRLTPWLLIGALVWFAMLKSGVHATLAGVAVAMTVPLRAKPAVSPLHRLEHRLQPWVAFVIVPIFGFANAGVSFAGLDPATVLGPVPLGVALGLFLGKQLGIAAAAGVAIKLGWASLPAHATWRQFYGVAILCGIGFTMSLFIGALAFGEGSALNEAAKLGVLAGSLLSALAGYLLLAGTQPASSARNADTNASG